MQDERLLLAQIATGDEEALRQLYLAYRPRLRRYLWHQLAGDHASVEDALQEVFLAVWRTAGGYRGEARVSTQTLPVPRMLLDLGGRHVTPYQKQYSYTLLHFQNGVWTPVPLSFDQSGTSILWDIAASSADDCWIIGYDTGTGDSFAVAHYHQGAWTSWSGSQLEIGVRYATPYAIALVAPDDVWVAGQYPYHDASGDHTGPLVLHFDGAHWTRAPLSDYQDDSNDHALMALAVQPSGGVWAFTQGLPYSLKAYIAHDASEANGGSGPWTWAAAPDPIVAMYGVVFVSESEAFGIAGVEHGQSSTILHYKDGVWSALPGA